MSVYQEKSLTGTDEADILSKVDPIEPGATKASVAYTFESALFSKEALEGLLAPTACEGIRFYTILHQETGSTEKYITLVAVPQNALANSMVGSTAQISEKHCPPDCKP